MTLSRCFFFSLSYNIPMIQFPYLLGIGLVQSIAVVVVVLKQLTS
jgi:hypothetical protein